MGIIVNTIPKSGTHLLLKLLGLLGLHRNRELALAPVAGKITPPSFGPDGLLFQDRDDVSLSAARYATIAQERYAQMADDIAQASAATCFQAHQLWSRAGAEILTAQRIKQLIIMRDPRAVALSHAEWTVDPINYHHLRDLLTGLPLHQRLHYEFFGLPSDTDARFDPLVPLRVRYRNMAPWAAYPFLYVTTFETLVGTNGPAAQEAEIEAVARFAGCTHHDTGKIQRELWGGSPTFRHGVADRWRRHIQDFPAGVDDQISEMLAIVAHMKTRTPVAA